MAHVVVGPARHGVVRHGLRIARAGTGSLVRLDNLGSSHPPLPSAPVIIHFTDRLFGADAPAAAREFQRLTQPATHVVTVLHDLPQPSDGHAWAARRAGYLAVVRSSDTVVVSSRHEVELLHAFAPGVEAVVVPLPLERKQTERDPAGVGQQSPGGAWPVVATLGFLYPGKGIEEVIDAVAVLERAGASPLVRNLGQVSPGHEELVGTLTERAAAQQVSWEITGWLEDEHLMEQLRAVDVPVAFHRHLSASASLATWVEAGRRPITPVSDYAQDLEQQCPGALWLVEPDLAALQQAIELALRRPDLTWLSDAVALGPSAAEVAETLENLHD